MPGRMEAIKAGYRRWREKLLPGGRSEAGENTTASGAITVSPLYTPADIEHLDYLRDSGFPGERPYTRGATPLANTREPWVMTVYSGFSSGTDCNARYRNLVAEGAKRLGVALDMPTQLGYDSDHPAVRAEVGKIGVAIDSLKDVEDLFEGVSLDGIGVFTTANATPAMALSWFLLLGKKQGLPVERMEIHLQNDILKEFLIRGTYIYPPGPSLRLAIDVVEYVIKELKAPRSWRPMWVCGTHSRYAGGSPATEIALVLTNAIAYVEAAIQRGLRLDDFVPRLEFHLCTALDIFEEAAKFRALRRLWAKLVKERFGGDTPEAQKMYITVATPGYLFTAQQPLNNVVRNTLAVLSAAVAGVEDVLTICHDEALGIPTREAHTLALRTQQIVAYESGSRSTVDPLGGSYYVESLTSRLEAEASKIIAEVDRLGGALAATEKGYFQNRVAHEAYQFQKDIESGKRTVVGVNRYRSEEEYTLPVFKVDPAAVQRQIDGLQAVKKARDGARVAADLRRLEEAARGDENLVPYVLEAVGDYATVGEISGVFRRVFGVHHKGL